MRRCAFCGGTAKLSGEHLWSAWISKLFPDEEKFIFRRQFADVSSALWWESKNLNPTAKVVCEPCNNEWMSELENVHARPALTPLIVSESPHRLTPRNAASIAAFMFKQAVICHFMDKTSAIYRPLFPAATLRRFAKTLEIPKNVQVWTASVRSETRHGTLRMRYKNTPLGAVNGFQLYAFTYSVGFFCGQMTIGRWTQTYRFDCALCDGIRSCD